MRDVLIARWSELADKIVKLAEELPEDKYEYRPAPEVRSFADHLRHVAFWNTYVQKTLRREKADGDGNELPRDTFPTKSKIVVVLRNSFDAIASQISKWSEPPDKADVDTLVSFLEHNGEHYGQMALYFRLNGLVPPASR